MKTIYLLSIFLVGFLSSCNQQKIETLEKELEQKESDIIELNQEIDELNQRLNYLSQFEPDYSIKVLTNNEVLQIFKDHVNFYCHDIKYSNIRVLKVDEYIYDISYDTFNSNVGYRDTGVSRLTLLPNDKYKIEVTNGPYC